MSGPVGVLLDRARVRLIARDNGASLLELPWNPSEPEAVVTRLRDLVDAPSACVLVVGLGFLEIARPALPPLSHVARRAVLLRDADRYFPSEGAVAVAVADDVAFAMPADQLSHWVRAFDALAPVRAVTTVAHAASLVAASRTNSVMDTDGDRGEQGRLVFERGMLREARRMSGPTGSDGTSRTLDAAETVRAALSFIDAPQESLLGDATLAARFASVRQMRWLRSAALLCLAAAALVWSANRWRERTLESLTQRAALLEVRTAPARDAQRRLTRALAERVLLTAADSSASAGADPATVLARLGALLPTDAFVQRLEFDGVSWRMDGSASNAPRIVPLLDADVHLQDVRILAASTRFLDGGRQRESFSIAFRTRIAPASTRTNGSR